LFAVLAGVFGFFIVNHMPRLYDPIDECESMRQATRDGWIVAITTRDSSQLDHVSAILGSLSPVAIEELPA
jgi:hypothetical protein